MKSKLSPLIDFSVSSWSAAERSFHHRSFRAGETIIEAGDIVTELHFLLNGIARYYYLTAEGKEFNKYFSRAGQVLSSISSLVNGTPTPFSIQALQPCDCMSIKYRDIVALCETDREWERFARRLLEQLAIKKERREADFLLLTPAERYKKFLIEFADVAGSIPNYHVASYLGITEVALSRIRKRLGLTRINRG